MFITIHGLEDTSARISAYHVCRLINQIGKFATYKCDLEDLDRCWALFGEAIATKKHEYEKKAKAKEQAKRQKRD